MTGRDARALVGLALVLVAGAWAITRLPPPPLADFIEYWVAAKLLLEGDNPWDEARVRELEQAAGRPGDPVLMWNPPWTLTLVLPLGLLEPRPAMLAWQAATVSALVASTYLLTLVYASTGRRVGVWLGAVTLLPCYIALAQGQISPLIPLGAVLFLVAQQARRDFFAGLACTLVSIKPQVGLLFWAALALWLVKTRRWRIPTGLAVGIIVGLVPPLLLNPQIINQYREAVTLHPPTQYASPTWGTFLRLVFGVELFRLQFVTPVIGLVWVAVYWASRKAWSWSDHLPLVWCVSVVTMAYGWFYDLVVLLFPVAQVAGSATPPPRWAVAAYLGINAAALIQVLFSAHGMWFIWAAPAFLALYLLVCKGTTNGT